jgi:hypothetical protein
MTAGLFRSINAADLEHARAAMATNMIAGDTLAIQRWRYSIVGSVVYAILRSLVYCIRHHRYVDSAVDVSGGPSYIYFTPTCKIALGSLARVFPGRDIGFDGKRVHSFPLRYLLFATILSFRSIDIWSWVGRDRRWRPWISDVLFYILTYRWAEQRFADAPPITFVYSNDHCCFDRGIVDASSRFGHVGVYVQHAAVTDIFPPLTADFSLLDGEQGLQVYASIAGSRGTVIVSGRQYDLVAIRERRRTADTVLVCASTIDTVESWRPVLKTMRAAGYHVLFRTHPSDRQVPVWKRMAEEVGIEWCDPQTHTLRDSMERAAIVLAGQSGVLLEAALSGATPVIIQFDEDTGRGLYDYFGFAASGIAFLAAPTELASLIRDVQQGKRTLRQDALNSFDIACSQRENMQVKAMALIIRAKGRVPDLESAGFARSDVYSSGGMTVFFPTNDKSVA